MSLIDDQIAREEQAVDKGVDRFMKVLNEDKAKGREFEGPVGQTMTRTLLVDVIAAVEVLQKEARGQVVKAQTKGVRLQGWEMPVALMAPESMAYIALKTVLISSPDKATRQVLGRRIGTTCNLQVTWDATVAAEKERHKGDAPDPAYNRVNVMKRQVKTINPKSVRKWLKKLDDLAAGEEWDNKLKIKVGAALLETLVRSIPDVLEYSTYLKSNTRKVMRVLMSDENRAKLQAEYQAYGKAHPWLQVTIAPPLHWRWHQDRFVGGYYKQVQPLIKFNFMKHTAAIVSPDTVPEVVLEALNRVQATPWLINGNVLDHALHAADKGIDAVLPVEARMDQAEVLDEAVWEAMDASAQGKVKNVRRQVHDHNYRLEAKRWSMQRQLDVAEGLLEEGIPFYFPHNLDFRGRAYPIPQDLHPQSDDFGRAMLTFAEGKPLGADGLQWLVFHLANCFGMDKASRGEQMEWYNAWSEEIYQVAHDPFGAGLEFWCTADEKARWQFLAAAIEVCRAFACSDPEAYVCHLPVHVDGSCNGLQHLSAMGRDPIGAHATNLTADPQRKDIYDIVAGKVNAALAPGSVWEGKVTRYTVKRGVMTMPYGLTPIGMRDQLIDDRWVHGLPGDDYENAGELRDHMLVAIRSTVSAAATTMAWMQDNATILAKNGDAVEWWAPSGFKVLQRYRLSEPTSIQTVVGGTVLRLDVYQEEAWHKLQVSKQASSIAPNIIHSFDAAHMMMSISASGPDLAYSVIHDSFGVHACDMPAFLQCIKEQFVEIYSIDWFWMLQEDFSCSSKFAYPLVDCPSPGAWNPEDVLKSEFFFA